MPLLLELGRAEALTNGPDAVAHLREAYDALPDPVARAHVAQGLAGTLLFTGRAAEGAAVAQEAAAALGAGHDELRLTLEAFVISAALFGAGDYREVLRFRAPAADAGVAGKMLLGVEAFARAYSCEPADAPVAAALAALAGGELTVVDPGGIPTIAAIVTLALADRDEAVAALDDGLAEAHRSGSLFGIAGVRLFRGYTLLLRGELADAQQELQTALDHLRTWGYGANAQIYGKAFLGTTLLERGDLAAARALLPDAEEPDEVADGVRFWLNAKLELLVAEGRNEEALRVGEVLRTQYDHVVLPAVSHRRSLAAEALDRLGRRDEALALAGEELELSRRWGAPRALGRALRVLGTVQREDGLAHLEEAVAVLEGSPARLEHAKALAALGSTLRRARRPTDAREPLRRALELAEACDASGLAEHVRSELYASGARPRTTALHGVESLTASERRVAELAAEGQTNRDIAQVLFVTPKTVEVHLTNAYRKLGIRSRRELPTVLAA